MIGYIKGKLKTIDSSSTIIVDSSGVGWSINLLYPDSFIEDQEVEFFVRTIVRENDIALWGFSEFKQIKMFDLLNSVSGVGPKTAFQILKTYSVEEIVLGILDESSAEIKVSGVGKKTVEKIKLLLKDKINKEFSSLNLNSANKINNALVESDIIKEVISALESLGYKNSEIEKALSDVENIKEYASAQALLRVVLVSI